MFEEALVKSEEDVKGGVLSQGMARHVVELQTCVKWPIVAICLWLSM